MSARDGLVVVVPKGFEHSRIPGLLERKRDWLEKAARRADQQRKFFRPEPPGKVPERILLHAIGEEWSVDYRPTGAPWVAAVERRGNRLLVYGDIDSGDACKQALQRWLNRKTHQHLVPWLNQLATEKGFQVRRVFVKSQRTRWASCSRHGAISINQKTLFIPADLVRYVFIHEFGHTVYLNHSARFWALVRGHAPDYKEKDRKLREAWRLVPAWLGQNRARHGACL
jgi:predicted metal-dependent hydrolase